MPNADKCHLLIPFKNYLKSLRVDADGRLDEASLAAAAAQEFENNKAIENRINDSTCGGGCLCSSGAVRSTTSGLALNAGTLTGTFGGFVDSGTGVALYSHNAAVTGGGFLLTPSYGDLFEVSAEVSIVNGGGTWLASGRVGITITVTSDLDEILLVRTVIAAPGGTVREQFTMSRPLRCGPGGGFGVGVTINTVNEPGSVAALNGANAVFVVEFLSIASLCCPGLPALVL